MKSRHTPCGRWVRKRKREWDKVGSCVLGLAVVFFILNFMLSIVFKNAEGVDWVWIYVLELIIMIVLSAIAHLDDKFVDTDEWEWVKR